MTSVPSAVGLVFVFLAGCWSSASPITAPPVTRAPARSPAPLSLSIDVLRWSCTVHYVPFDSRELHVPLGRPIHVTLTSLDVPHDVEIAGRTVHLERGAPQTIDFTVEHVRSAPEWTCPMDLSPHAEVGSSTHPIVLDDFESWAANEREIHSPTTTAGRLALGRRLYKNKSCVGCHTVDGTPRIGPSWKGIWGTTITGQDGTTRTVDAAFVRESIVTPRAFAPPSYPPSMPSFDGQLRDIEIESITAYIESLN